MASECGFDIDTPRRNYHSQWLPDAVSEFDAKVKAIKSLLGQKDEKNCFPTSSEDVPSKKQEILRILEELERSYSSLAESHDKLRSGSKEAIAIASGICDDPGMMDSSDPESTVEDPENPDFDLPIRPTDKVLEVNVAPFPEFRIIAGYSKREKSEEQCQFEVMRLIEESLREQAELVRRNEEKRGIIQRLRSEIEGLKMEMRTLQECLTRRKIDLKRVDSNRNSSNRNSSSPFKMSRLRGFVMEKIFGRSLSRASS